MPGKFQKCGWFGREWPKYSHVSAVLQWKETWDCVPFMPVCITEFQRLLWSVREQTFTTRRTLKRCQDDRSLLNIGVCVCVFERLKLCPASWLISWKEFFLSKITWRLAHARLFSWNTTPKPALVKHTEHETIATVHLHAAKLHWKFDLGKHIQLS